MNKRHGFGKGQENVQKKIDIMGQLDQAMARIGASKDLVTKR